MAAYIQSIFLLAILTQVKTQLFDYFSPSLIQPTINREGFPYEFIFTENNNNRNQNRRNKNNEVTTKRYDDVFNQNIPFASFLDAPRRGGNTFFVNNNNYNNDVITTTTSKPNRKVTTSSHRNNNKNTDSSPSNGGRKKNKQTNTNRETKPVWSSEKNNNILDDVYTSEYSRKDVTTENTNNFNINRNEKYPNREDKMNHYIFDSLNYSDNSNTNRNNYNNERYPSSNTANQNNQRYPDNNERYPNNYETNNNNGQIPIRDNPRYPSDTTTEKRYPSIDRWSNNNNQRYPSSTNERNPSFDSNVQRYPTSNKDRNPNINNDGNPIYNNRNPNENDRYPNTNNRNPYDSVQTTRKPEYTQRPFYTNAYTNRAPITNRPIWGETTTKKVSYTDGIRYPSAEESGTADPTFVMGPDEDKMSAAEKRRLIELTERMCDKYKTLDTKQVQAIPLLPSPVAVSVNVTDCADPAPLIVGGQAVSIEQFPHNAAVGWRNTQGRGYSYKCGGSLISERFVLTAAHCSYQDRDDAVVSGPPSVVQLGSTYIGGPDAQVIPVVMSIRHPKYKPPVAYYDIALLKLSERVSFSDKIKPACIGDPPRPGQKLIATGWGKTEFGGTQSRELRGVSLPVWTMESCTEALPPSRRLPRGPQPDSQVCAGDQQGRKDTCQGDSGGGAVTLSNCVAHIRGVTSLGRACAAQGTPAIYALPKRAFIAAVVFDGQF